MTIGLKKYGCRPAARGSHLSGPPSNNSFLRRGELTELAPRGPGRGGGLGPGPMINNYPIRSTVAGKYRQLIKILKSMDRVLVAFSGGVDSSLLLRAAKEALGDRVLAVVINSPVFHQEEIREARKIAQKLKVRYLVVNSDYHLSGEFRRNTPLRCYHCKLSLFKKLKTIARDGGMAAVVEGSNLDDELDYRPGEKALRELGIRSPLKEAGLKKSEIRILAKALALPNWSRPSNACLATRIPYNQPVEIEWLKKISRGEDLLRQMGFTQVRLRHHRELVRIEVLPSEIAIILKAGNREKIIRRLKKLGWRYVVFDLEGYRSGSLNPVRL